MTARLRSIITAVTLTALVTEITTVVVFLTVFFMLKGSEAMLEAWGLMAHGWGEAHPAGLSIAAAIPTALGAAVLAAWLYRRVMETERTFERSPPQ